MPADVPLGGTVLAQLGSGVGHWRQPGHPCTQIQSGVLVLLPRGQISGGWQVLEPQICLHVAWQGSCILFQILLYIFIYFLPVFIFFSSTSFSWGWGRFICCFLIFGSIDPALTPSHHFLGQAPAPRGVCRQQQVSGGGPWGAGPLSAAVKGTGLLQNWG